MTSDATRADAERYVDEPSKNAGRSEFARDRARVLHSSALRRLAAKTQVVVAGQADFPRTRLTHTLEVAQVGRELGAALGCDPDIVEVAGLAHDLGHPPFGHNGEDALNDVAAAAGGFEGNAQSFRVLTRLEAKATDPVTGESVGLNLTRASLDAASKYPWARTPNRRKFGVYQDDLEIFDWVRRYSTGERTCLEAQVMDWADDVAYSVHDIEDAVHLQHLDLAELKDPEQLAAVVSNAHRRYARDIDEDELHRALITITSLPVWPRAFDGSMASLVALKDMTSELIGRFCSAAQRATQDRYGHKPLSRYDATLILPTQTRAEVAVLKAVTAHFVMFRAGTDEAYRKQRDILTELVSVLVLSSGRELEPWLQVAYRRADSDAERLRVVIDQVASLTDVSAVAWHRRLCR